MSKTEKWIAIGQNLTYPGGGATKQLNPAYVAELEKERDEYRDQLANMGILELEVQRLGGNPNAKYYHEDTFQGLEALTKEMAESIVKESPCSVTIGMVCHFCEQIISWEKYKADKEVFDHEKDCIVLKAEQYLKGER